MPPPAGQDSTTPDSHAQSVTPKEPRPAASTQAGSTASWVITLFGTAVGAGILFLPLDAGKYGFIPLIFATVFVLPLVYFSHRTYARIVSGAPVKDHGKDVLELIDKFLGPKKGLFVAILYWLAIYPTVLIYGVSITNAVDSFIVNQLNGPEIPRPLLAALCVGIMTGAFAFGRKPMLWLAQILVYPLIIALAAVSFYLIPRWDLASFMSYDGVEGDLGVLQGILLILPVMVFSFSHMAGLSQFSLDMQPAYGDRTEQRVSRTELWTAILLVVFTMFFAWSCVLALGAEGMAEADAQNIPVLSYFANVTGTPFMEYMTPVLVMCAIITSYFGHMLGTEEGTEFLLRSAAPSWAERVNPAVLKYGIYLFVFMTVTLVAIINPSIMDLISVVGGIFVVFLVYWLPVYVFKTVREYRPFRNDPWYYFVVGMGIITAGVTVWNLLPHSP